MASSRVMGFRGKVLLRTMRYSPSSGSSGAKVDTSLTSSARSKAPWRSRFSRRVLFFRICRSRVVTAASMEACISEVLSDTRKMVPLERMVISTLLFRSFSTLNVMAAVASSLKKRSSLPTFFSAYLCTESGRFTFLSVNTNFIAVAPFAQRAGIDRRGDIPLRCFYYTTKSKKVHWFL